MNVVAKKDPERGIDPRFGDWIQTVTGVRFYPCDPHADEVRIEDIAHALSNLCRFAGHTSHFYSVAQHSVLVSQIVPFEHAFWGLLHDATEAYLVDLPRPVKRSAFLEGYRQLEHRLEEVIAERFGLAQPIPEEVKRADLVLLATERRDLFSMRVGPWKTSECVAPLEAVIYPWSPDIARDRFLRRFDEIVGRVPR